ncbi:MAG: HEPN domain-containing protein [Bacteroidia bacterium]|nr:HEPN domain-containing protein [Bacteroidia bacterium]
MKAITREWLESANLDFENIRHIIHDDRLTGHVAFHAQQAIEKSLKASIEEFGQKVPRIHSISKLITICTPFIDVILDEEVVVALDSLYMESRYPGEFGLLPEGKPSLKMAQKFFDCALEVYEKVWRQLEIRKQL